MKSGLKPSAFEIRPKPAIAPDKRPLATPPTPAHSQRSLATKKSLYQVTPTRVYFSGPEINMSNRVLRKYRRYIDNFLRVSFIDEEWDKMYSTDLSARVAGRTQLYERVLSTLRNGIRIGNKKFEFLAFSSSQLRENSLWMFASTYELDADDIRQWMGDFSSIRNVAKYAARLGQSFGSSTETLSLNQQEVERIPDVEVVTNGTRYIFSDGIGKISSDFAAMVALKCGVSVPSAFQIRYKGYKGVVAVDPTSSKKLSLRQSMLKYQLKDESDNNQRTLSLNDRGTVFERALDTNARWVGGFRLHRTTLKSGRFSPSKSLKITLISIHCI